MSNLQTVERIYAAFGRGDIPQILEALSPKVEWEYDVQAEGIPWVVPRRGRDEVARFFASLADLEFHHFEPLRLFESGNEVMATLRVEATVKSTGKRLRDLEGHLFTFDPEGRIARFRHFIDTDQHLRALRK